MEDDILTIEEVAKYLRVSERTVYDWAQKGEIPSGKIGTVWRFKKSEIEKWVNDRLSSGTKANSVNQVIQIRNILSPDRIVYISQSTKHDALVELAANLSTAPQVKFAKELETEILKREELMSTACLFLQNDLNMSKTSKSAFMHRNTLIYRLEKINKLIHLNLRCFADAVMFKNMIEIYKLIMI